MDIDKRFVAFIVAIITLAILYYAYDAKAAGHKQSITIKITNNMAEELIAPVLITSAEHDELIFIDGNVSKASRSQVLTGDPKDIVKRIGDDATVAHGTDGPPAVLLAPGKSITVTIKHDDEPIRLFAMIAPTKTPDNFVTGLISPYLTSTIELGRYDIGDDEKTNKLGYIGRSMILVTVNQAMH